MIKLENVCVSYPDKTPALKSVGFQIPKGAKCAVLGANGAGKSTLLAALMALIDIQSGAAFLNGIAVCRKNAEAVRKTAALVFQNSDDQLFFPTVLEDIMFGAANAGYSEAEAKIKAEKLLESFGILRLKDRHIQRLSDGEKKKAAICSALAQDPEILFLDEPSALLDPKSRRESAEFILGLDKTVMLTTHDLDFARACCEYSLILKEGRLAAFGKTPDILADKALLLDSSLM
ncbi:MAG: ABC transporter ATP-binding protein [Opitutales bacterium]|nr:ABC transporter ATP-binding protein [Opitutales bacterium]